MKIAVLVSNDLSFDQRVRKTCQVLVDAGHEVVLVGRLLSDSVPYEGPGSAIRLPLRHTSGVFFYAELQFALWTWLKTADIDAVWSNDLDTLLPALRISRRRNIRIVYDSHEYFTEAAGLTGHPLRRFVWLTIERYCIPKLNKMELHLPVYFIPCRPALSLHVLVVEVYRGLIVLSLGNVCFYLTL